MQPHRHRHLINQWADGHKVEVLSRVDGMWYDEEYPDWDEDYEFRIKGQKTWLGFTDEEVTEAIVRECLSKISGLFVDETFENLDAVEPWLAWNKALFTAVLEIELHFFGDSHE